MEDLFKRETFCHFRWHFSRIFRRRISKRSSENSEFLKNYLEKLYIPVFLRTQKFSPYSWEKVSSGKYFSFSRRKGIQREGIYFGEDFTVSFQGRADLIIETDQRKEIIDYKTGKQLMTNWILCFLLYGEDKNVEGRYFNLWDGIFLPPRKRRP